MQAVYDTQLVGIEFYENNTQLIMNALEFSSLSSVGKSQNGTHTHDEALTGGKLLHLTLKLHFSHILISLLKTLY